MCVYINKKTKKQKKTTTAAGKKIMRVKIKPWGRLVFFFFFFFFFFLKKKGLVYQCYKNFGIWQRGVGLGRVGGGNCRLG